MSMVAVGGILCEMDSTAGDLFNQAIAERDAARDEAAAAGAEIMRLVADLDDCRDELQDWQVAAGVRKDERDVAVKERDAARAEIDELRAVMAEWWVERYQHTAPSSIIEDAEAALRKSE